MTSAWDRIHGTGTGLCGCTYKPIQKFGCSSVLEFLCLVFVCAVGVFVGTGAVATAAEKSEVFLLEDRLGKRLGQQETLLQTWN